MKYGAALLEKLESNKAIKLAREYGFGVEVVRQDMPDESADVSYGPMHHGIDVKKQKLYVEEFYLEDMAEEEQEVICLHEVMHLICHPPGLKIQEVCEGWLLIPMETYMVRSLHFSREIAYKLRNETSLDPKIAVHPADLRGTYSEVGAWARPERSVWWRRATERAVRVGLLYPNRTPTFKRANWKALSKADRERVQGTTNG